MTVSYRDRYTHEAVKTKTVDTELIKRLLVFLKPYKFWVFIAIVVLILAKAIEAWVPIQIGYLAQTIVDHQGDPLTAKQAIFQSIIYSSLAILGLILLSYILDIFNILIKNWVGQKAILALRMKVYRHIQKLPLSLFDRYPIGRLMTRTIHDIEQINQLFSESVIPLIGSLFLFFGILLGIFFLNWRIGIFYCLLLPILWWFVNHFRYNQRRSYDAIRSIVSAMNTFVQEHLMGVHVVRNFGLFSKEKKKFDQLNYDYYEANMETAHQFSFFFSGIEFLQNLSMAGVFLLLAYMASSEQQFEVGTFFTVSIYGLMIFRPLLDLAERYNMLQAAMAASERVFDILDVAEEKESNDSGQLINQIETIEFKNVWFAYENENWVLKGLSFKLNKGESLALVGVTGSGKTTVINILLRLYPFQKGKILINGQDIHLFTAKDLRKQMSVILQEPVIFSGTLKENISLYHSNIKEREIEDSVQFVNIDSLAKRSPDGLNQRITERGTNLSVGEMQLISLARAVAHKRSFLILDEATANIDSHTERIIQETIEKVLAHRTALVIAHRLSTIKNVTRIVVLSNGVALESGTHHELLQKKGLYEKIYQLQFQYKS